jgi:FKBP-type peptidyl-prolyl cis-trans isomerase 2
MSKAKEGDKVKVHYTGTLEDGTVFDTSEQREPLEFTVGENMLLQKFEETVSGMEPGEERKVTIAAEDAYGEYREGLTLDVERSQIPDDIQPEVGLMLQVSTVDGGTANVTIVDVDEEKVTLDANHPLAGKDLNFDIKLVEIAE